MVHSSSFFDSYFMGTLWHLLFLSPQRWVHMNVCKFAFFFSCRKNMGQLGLEDSTDGLVPKLSPAVRWWCAFVFVQLCILWFFCIDVLKKKKQIQEKKGHCWSESNNKQSNAALGITFLFDFALFSFFFVLLHHYLPKATFTH